MWWIIGAVALGFIAGIFVCWWLISKLLKDVFRW